MMRIIPKPFSGDGMRTLWASRPRVRWPHGFETEVKLHRLGDLFADRQHRIEEGHGVLKDHCDLMAANAPHFGFALGAQALPVEGDPVGGYARILCQQAHDGKCGYRFARARFADDAERFAGAQLKRQSVDGGDRTVFGAKGCLEIFYVEQRIARPEIPVRDRMKPVITNATATNPVSRLSCSSAPSGKI